MLVESPGTRRSCFWAAALQVALLRQLMDWRQHVPPINVVSAAVFCAFSLAQLYHVRSDDQSRGGAAGCAREVPPCHGQLAAP
jgi:hypothetical protein